MQIPFSSQRLSYREFRESDADRIQEISDSPGFSFILLDKKDAQTGIKFVAERMNDARNVDPDSGARRHYRLAVCLNSPGERLIGYIGLFNIDFKLKNVELAFFIDPQEQRKGYAREAAQAVMLAAHKQLHLVEFYATTREDNAASRTVIESVGLRLEEKIPNKYGDNVATRLLFRLPSGEG